MSQMNAITSFGNNIYPMNVLDHMTVRKYNVDGGFMIRMSCAPKNKVDIGTIKPDVKDGRMGRSLSLDNRIYAKSLNKSQSSF